MTNALCIDIGNTLLKLAVFSGDEMVHFECIEKDKTERIIEIVNNREIQYAISSSVAEIPEPIFTFLEQKLTFFMQLDHHTLIPVENLYETKETLGKDRIAAVVGAQYLYPGQNLLIIDAGSAITYDLLTAEGKYPGGNISPGMAMRYQALHTFTKRLPLIKQGEILHNYGRNTEEAIRVGVQLGVINEMDGFISLYSNLYPDLKVLITGGDNKFFGNKLNSMVFVVSNLVLIGLNRILQFNLKNLFNILQ